MYYNALINNENQIIWDMPYGKPDRKNSIEGKEEQKRIARQSQKGDTCWWYAIQDLRNSCPKDISEREMEKKFSIFRKKMTISGEIKKNLNNFLYNFECGVKIGLFYDKETSHRFIESFISGIEDKNIAGNIEKRITEFFKTNEMSITNDNFKKFINKFELYIESDFFKNNRSVTCEFSEKKLLVSSSDVVKRLTCISESLQEVPMQFRAEIVNQQFLDGGDKKVASLFKADIVHRFILCSGLKKSTWTPSKGIELMILDLKKYGVMIAAGKLGAPFYTEKPFKLSSKIGEKEVWGWSPNSYNEKAEDAHMVVVIGAGKVEKEEHVYFVDPNDPSDPLNPMLRKIYKMSYKRFTTVISDVWNGGLLGKESERGYLVYNQKFKL